MKERVADLLGPEARRVWLSTFHSFCARILRDNAEALEYRKSFSIYDESESLALIKRIYKDIGIPESQPSYGTAQVHISRAKEKLVNPDDYLASAKDFLEQNTARVYFEYQKRLAQNHAFDFDDLLMKAVEIFENHPEILKHYQNGDYHNRIIGMPSAADRWEKPFLESTAKNAGWLDLRMVPQLHNAVKVLLFLDVGGSMDDHIRLMDIIAKLAGGLADAFGFPVTFAVSVMAGVTSAPRRRRTACHGCGGSDRRSWARRVLPASFSLPAHEPPAPVSVCTSVRSAGSSRWQWEPGKWASRWASAVERDSLPAIERPRREHSCHTP